MKETNRKILMSSLGSLFIGVFASWWAFSPVTPDPTVKTVRNGNQSYYVVSIEGKHYATRVDKFDSLSRDQDWRVTWINMETGEDVIRKHTGVPFTVDTSELSNIVNERNSKIFSKTLKEEVLKAR